MTLIERARAYCDGDKRSLEAAIEAQDIIKALAALPPATAWLVELGSMPPQWWTGRGDEWTPHVDGTLSTRGNGADSAIRFARREDAERAIGWLLNKHVARGCKATEHLWLAASPPVQEAFKDGYNAGKEAGLEVARNECCYAWEYYWNKRQSLAASPPAQERP